MAEHKPSQTVEDYLLVIYTMRRDNETVIPARLKERMGVTAPTALATLRRMERDGLVSLHRGQQIQLTTEGTEAAESILRRHMLAERLLVDILKLGWADSHEEAHLMEHAITPRIEAQLLQLLGNPTTCPHGNPIPGLQRGPLPETKTLREAKEGEDLVINNVMEHAEEDFDLMQWLERSGLVPNSPIKVEEIALSNATITVLVKDSGNRVVVGLPAAQVVKVRKPAL
jgi:DtxR family Mn-dependent transcriptional regulator